MEICPINPVGSQYFQFLPEFLTEMPHDFLTNVEFRRRGKARDRRRFDPFPLGQLPDEPSRIEVIRAKIVSPLGDAVGFVKHPRRNFALPNRFLKAAIAQLLGRYVQQGESPHLYALKYVTPLRHGQQSIQRRRKVRAPRPGIEILHLVFHQRLERGNHDGQCPDPLVVHDRGQLETQRLAAAGGHNSEQRTASHAKRYEPLLEAGSVWRSGRGAEAGMAEILGQLLAGVVMRRAISAVRVAAIHSAD